jgi:hypothetical protein
MMDPLTIPGGTLMLEPREMYDKALVGVVHRGGETCALYSRQTVIELLVSEEDLTYEEAVEHYEFNVSGSIGWGYPMFLMESEEDMEIAKHGFVKDPKTPTSVICSSCKLPEGHPVHDKRGPVVIHGTVRPEKVG